MLAFAIAMWIQLRPQVFALLEAQVARVKQAQLHDFLVAMVHAAEQVYGPQPADPVAAENLGANKLNYVVGAAVDKGFEPTTAEVEAAVHVVKTGGLTVGTAVQTVGAAVNLANG
jgi:hypothetical protein